MNAVAGGIAERLVGRMNLRFPGLFVLFAILAGVDFLLPDFLPFVDEIALALLAALFGTWRRRRSAPNMTG